MAKHNKASKKKSGDDDLEGMREAFRKHKNRSKGGGGGSNDWDKLSDGKNMRRVLPIEGARKFYTEGWTHFNVGPNNRAVRCIDEEHINEETGRPESGTKCPLCRKFLKEQARINSEYEKGDEDGQAEWKRARDKYTPRHQYYSNVLREDDDGDFEVKILAFGPQVWGQLMNFYVGDDTNIGDFTSLEEGRWMNIKKVKKGGRDRRNVEYEVYPGDEEEDISDAWDQIKEALHDLDAAAGKTVSKEEMLAIMKGVDVDKESGDDDDDDEDDEDDDDDRDEDGDEEEEEESDEEEEEDEDDKPVKVKKSKLSKKMKRRNRDDD